MIHACARDQDLLSQGHPHLDRNIDGETCESLRRLDDKQPHTATPLALVNLSIPLCRIHCCPTLMTLKESHLLAKVKQLGDASKSDLVRAADYVTSRKDGRERLNFTAFHEALLEA